MTAPAWITNDAWRELHPPAEILVLGELPRAPEKLLAASRALCVTTAPRYQPTVAGTKCNIFASDLLGILAAPLPHWADLGEGYGLRELNVNDTFAALHAGKFPGWTLTGTIASASAVIALAAEGRPQFAIWPNRKPLMDPFTRTQKRDQWGRPRFHSGHISAIVPTPVSTAATVLGAFRGSGVYITSAGAHCVQECPIEESFGAYTPQVEIWSFRE